MEYQSKEKHSFIYITSATTTIEKDEKLNNFLMLFGFCKFLIAGDIPRIYDINLYDLNFEIDIIIFNVFMSRYGKYYDDVTFF